MKRLGVRIAVWLFITQAIRTFAVALLGLVLVGCGLGIPQPTEQQVLDKDVAGTTWQYRGAAPATNCEITFNGDRTYSLVHCQPGSVVTNSGGWMLSRSYLELFAFGGSSPTFEGHRTVRWWFTDLSTNRVVLFGGDSFNPRQWVRLSRIGSEPGVASQPFPVVIGADRAERIDLVRAVGFGLVAGVALCIVAPFGLRLWRALSLAGVRFRNAVTKPGTARTKVEPFSGRSVASDILPQIERLRGSHLLGAPVTARQTQAHKSLVSAARRFLALFSYFRKSE